MRLSEEIAFHLRGSGIGIAFILLHRFYEDGYEDSFPQLWIIQGVVQFYFPSMGRVDAPAYCLILLSMCGEAGKSMS